MSEVIEVSGGKYSFQDVMINGVSTKCLVPVAPPKLIGGMKIEVGEYGSRGILISHNDYSPKSKRWGVLVVDGEKIRSSYDTYTGYGYMTEEELRPKISKYSW